MTVGSEVVNNALFKHKIKYQHFDEWKGVFEKFISKDNLDITVDGYLGDETYGISGSSPTFTDWKWFDNFKQLLLWYFNN
jgi:hypothetical protein